VLLSIQERELNAHQSSLREVCRIDKKSVNRRVGRNTRRLTDSYIVSERKRQEIVGEFWGLPARGSSWWALQWKSGVQSSGSMGAININDCVLLHPQIVEDYCLRQVFDVCVFFRFTQLSVTTVNFRFGVLKAHWYVPSPDPTHGAELSDRTI
jgi:hypothetical protein